MREEARKRQETGGLAMVLAIEEFKAKLQDTKVSEAEKKIENSIDEILKEIKP